MKAIINFLILFFCINISIIVTTCYSNRRWSENHEPVEYWLDNYVFTGISQECNWYFTNDLISKNTRGDTIVMKDPPAHILYPDSFFGYNLTAPIFKYKRVECQFDVKAPVDHGLVVTIQQMNFDKKCSDFVQLTNQDGSLDRTICDKFGGFIPRSYPDSKYLGEINLKEHNKDSSKWEVFDAAGRIRVKISITKKNFENLRYLFIAFTALKKDPPSDDQDNTEYFHLQRRYFCDGIKNSKSFRDENHCASDRNEQINFIIALIGFLFLAVALYCYISCNLRKRQAVPVQPLTTTPDLVNTPSVNLDNNNDNDLPTYEILFPEKFQQVPSALPH